MKKILFIIACFLQFANAQTTPETGEYISVDKTSSGINLMLNNDKTFQLFFFNGTYEFVNDSIIFNESLESKEKNAFNVQFSKNKSTSKKLKFTIKLNFMMGFNNEFLGLQNKENGEIEYKSIYEYIRENKEDEEILKNSYLEDEIPSFTFELEKPYAIYLVADNKTGTKIEKYLIKSDITEMIVENNSSLFDNIKLAGNINTDQSINVFLERKPMKFVNKKKQAESVIFEKPASKTTEVNWTFNGKKDAFNFYGDSDTTSVVVDTTAVDYEEYGNESDYKFAAKVETSFEEAFKNLKNKYLVIYYNPKSKDQKKEFDNIIEDYNQEVGYEMYEGYIEESDKFNFYLATSKDEKFFSANGITKFPATIIVNEKKQLLASSKSKYRSIANEINRYNFIEEIEIAKNAIQIDEVLNAKKTDNAKLAKLLADEDGNFYTRFLDDPLDVTEEVYEDEATDTTAVAMEIDESYYQNSFTSYSLKTTQATFNQKMKDLFVSFQAKKIADEELIGILLNEITNNHNSLRFFKKENTISKDDIKKYLAYAITYNGDKSKKTKILNTVAGYILGLEDKNDIAYEEIARSIMVSSNYDAFQTKTYLEVIAHKNSKIEEAVTSVNQFYNNINANQSLFENLNTQFDNMNDAYKRNSSWNDFKNLYSSVFVVASENIIKHNETAKFNEVQKWLDCANKISRDNLEVIKVSYDYYTIVGNKAKAEEFKAKFDILNKE